TVGMLGTTGGQGLAKDSSASPAPWFNGGSGADVNGFVTLVPCGGSGVSTTFQQEPQVLKDGRILSVGGGNSWDVVEVNESGVSGRRCFIYNPVTETWVNTGDLGTPRGTHASIPLLDGRVIT